MSTLNTAFVRITFDIFYVWYDNSDRARLDTFAVNKDLCDILAFNVDTLDFLGCNIFAL